jgi:predicted phage terminase large subunit-like protein
MVRRTQVEKQPTSLIASRIEMELVTRDRERLTPDFRAFVEEAFSQVEPYEFKPGMHIDAIAEHLQALYERKIKSLLINIQPRSAKSTLTSVLFPAWVLANDPTETILSASYSGQLSMRDNVKCRQLIESEWFQARWPTPIKEDSNLKTHFALVAGGGRQATATGGTVTGMGGSIRILDDPINAVDKDSVQVRETVNDWFDHAWASRINGDPERALELVVMQRLHFNDISQKCIDAGWERLILPTEYEGDTHQTSIGWRDPRTEHGQLLWPEQWNQKYVEGLKKRLGSYEWAQQYQQRPAPTASGLFRKSWMRFYWDPKAQASAPNHVTYKDEAGLTQQCHQEPWLRPEGAQVLTSWDLSFKGEEHNDYSVGQVWCQQGATFYLMDQWKDHAEFTSVCAAIKKMDAQWHPYCHLVEEKANGAAVISQLRNEVAGLIPINPEGGKLSRASSVSPLMEAGNIWFPHPAQAPWVEELINDLLYFPAGKNDDTVDALTQAINRLRGSTAALVSYNASGTGAGESEEDTTSLIQDYYWTI